MLPDTAVAAAIEKRRTSLLAFGPFSFDRNSRMLRRGEELVPLPPRAVAVLELLLERAGDVVPRQELIDTVWKDAFVTDTSLAEAVSFLRQTLGDDPQAPGYIQTVHRRGYRFIAPVTPPVAGEPSTASERISPSIATQLLPWSVAALSLATAIAAVWHVASRESAAPPIVRFEVATPAGTRLDTRGPALAIAPGGTHLAWSGCDASTCRLYVRRLDRLDAAMLAGTDGAAAPFFSPDGRSIAYFSGGKLRRVPVDGGTSVPIADAADAMGGAWTERGEIIYAGARLGLSVVDDDGGDARPLTVPLANDGEVRHAWPSLADGGRTLLFTVLTTPSGDHGGRIAVMRMPGGSARPSWKSILDGATRAQAIRHDAIVFSRAGDLAAIGFDPIRLGVSGTAQPLVSGAAMRNMAASFAASPSGALAYMPAEGTMPADRQSFVVSAMSPDGARVAAAVADGARTDIWVAALESGAATRLTHDGVNGAPVWASDGRSVYFARRLGGAYEMWKRDADATTAATRVLAAAGHVIPLSTSADAKTVLISQTTADTGLDIWVVPAGGGAPRPLVRTVFDETAATLSPDGRFIAYQSNESGRWDVHVLRLQDGRRTVVSADGGLGPVWEPQGLRIRYRTPAKTMVASLVAGEELRVLAATEAPEGDRRQPVAIDAAGRVRFETAPPPLRRAIVALSFDREVRQILGPQPAAMPR